MNGDLLSRMSIACRCLHTIFSRWTIIGCCDAQLFRHRLRDADPVGPRLHVHLHILLSDGRGIRRRSSESIIEEIGYLQENYRITYFAFSDELLMSSVNRTMALCEDFLRSGLKFRWRCNGRLNYANPELLQLMKRAGCVFINYGIEAMDDQVLKKMKKGLTVKQIVKGVEETLDAGISPGLNIIFGNLGDNRQTLNKGVELLKDDDGAQMRTIRPVTPYPGALSITTPSRLAY